MASDWRTARRGLVVLAVLIGAEAALRVAMRVVYSAIAAAPITSSSSTTLFRVADVLGWAYFLIDALAIAAWWMIGRVPERTRARGWAVMGLAAAIGALALDGAYRVAGAAHVDVEWAYQALGVAATLVDGLGVGALAVVLVRAGVPSALPATFAALYAAGALKSVVFLVARPKGLDAVHTAFEVLGYVRAALVVATLVLGVRAFGRAATEDSEAPPPEAGAIAREWMPVADGIGLYVFGAIGRVVVLVLGYASTIASAQSQDFSSARGSAVLFALLGALAALVMMAGIWRIARAPGNLAGPGAMTALAMMILGLLLDAYATSLLYEMFGGSLSAAFAAMDQLPYVTVVAQALGITGAVALLGALGAIASAIELPDEAERARTLRVLVIVAGTVAAFAQLGATKLPSALLVPLALVVLPLALAAVVMYLRLLAAIARTIRSRAR